MQRTFAFLKGFLFLTVLCSATVLGQASAVRGTVTDAETREALSGATVQLVGTRFGAATTADGSYSISGVPAGTYTIRVSFLGYATVQQTVSVSSGTVTRDFAMAQSAIQQRDVIVEVNRARDRETPVAFTNIDKEQIDQRIHGQDAPLLLKGTPGLYAFSTDGVGNGESKLFVRGFNQNYVQVLINGIPTNDPESNSVYWSNWGSVSSAAASVQVQRGAGSSLYGAGSFGGSFNIVTGEAKPKRYYGLNFSLGDPVNTMYGVDLNTGLIDNAYAFSVRLDRKVGEGNRLGGRYEGYNYYLSGSWFMDEQQSLKMVLHGAPQEHGYSFSNDISYFDYFDYKANSAPWLPKSVVQALPASPNTGKASYSLLDGRRELITPDYVTLAHNHFHKPQLELHYNNQLTETSALRATFFFSRGRGGGSSLNSSGSVSNALRAANGSITNPLVADTLYLRNAYQRDSYSLHEQTGLLASYDFRPIDNLKVTAGGEFRYWVADHPGHFTNLYGKSFLTAQRYAIIDSTGATTTATFTRRTYEGDVAQENDVAIFGWELSKTDPQYRTQYRNYLGTTPQYTLFANASYNLLPNLILSGTLQYVYYTYDLKENMPSENAFGRRLTLAQRTALGLTDPSKEGPHANGKFYMVEYTNNTGTTVRNWYEFDLIEATRSRGFLQPKFGVNYNMTENFNLFGNFSHVERFVDLGVYYNQGRLNPDAKDETSDQYEIGAGWTSRELNAKVNLYRMTWDNKSQRIQDITQAGQPGYDRNGFKTILVGTGQYQGVEFEFNSNLDWLLPVRGFEVRGSVTLQDNTWESVLPEAKVLGGRRAVFNASARDANNNIDTLFVDELAGTNIGGPPQQMMSFGLTYKHEAFFAGLDVYSFAKHYGLDGNVYIRTGGSWNAAKTTYTYKLTQTLPDRMLIDVQAGYRLSLMGFSGVLTGQITNLLDEKYLADVDNFGVIPGGLRSYRLNLSVGL